MCLQDMSFYRAQTGQSRKSKLTRFVVIIVQYNVVCSLQIICMISWLATPFYVGIVSSIYLQHLFALACSWRTLSSFSCCIIWTFVAFLVFVLYADLPYACVQ
uniref:LSM7-like n=1 Tax=Arundo donax TaxID=35708 RepID=A0A0A9DGT6_ARUDO